MVLGDVLGDENRGLQRYRPGGKSLGLVQETNTHTHPELLPNHQHVPGGWAPRWADRLAWSKEEQTGPLTTEFLLQVPCSTNGETESLEGQSQSRGTIRHEPSDEALCSPSSPAVKLDLLIGMVMT